MSNGLPNAASNGGSCGAVDCRREPRTTRRTPSAPATGPSSVRLTRRTLGGTAVSGADGRADGGRAWKGLPKAAAGGGDEVAAHGERGMPAVGCGGVSCRGIAGRGGGEKPASCV